VTSVLRTRRFSIFIRILRRISSFRSSVVAYSRQIIV
jgi:hypothetical protein